MFQYKTFALLLVASLLAGASAAPLSGGEDIDSGALDHAYHDAYNEDIDNGALDHAYHDAYNEDIDSGALDHAYGDAYKA
ncbi:hypothetical protein WOLCODRAFT_28710 [Wolfiporia cocos MD-104 SS10]|uniref:Uncharacterized protein n=1 Tax=Wolfiporia cocos (strain MD-104) TaxID=742152 RepID=A0A2H3JKX4_WOLCO|nr:hypothetical protein WOLCODRAFT_28710 [Wolfiporia cocos MD-104 SS10]